MITLIILLQSWVVLQMPTDGFADHGVLSHKNGGMVSQRTTDLLELLGSDVIGSDDEAFRVLVKKLLFNK